MKMHNRWFGSNIVWNSLPVELRLLDFTASVQETTENVPVLG